MPGKTTKKQAPAKSKRASKKNKPAGAPQQDPPIIIKGGSLVITLAPGMSAVVKDQTITILPDTPYKAIFFWDQVSKWKPIGDGTGTFEMQFYQ